MGITPGSQGETGASANHEVALDKVRKCKIISLLRLVFTELCKVSESFD